MQEKTQYEINRKSSFQPCFEGNSGFFSRMFFIWTHKLIKQGSRKHLQMNDLSDLMKREQPKPTFQQFSKVYTDLDPSTPKKISKSFLKYLGPTFLLASFLATLANALQFSGPIVINQVLNCLKQDKQPIVGIMWVSLLVVCYLFRTIIFQHSMHFVNLSCIRVLNSSNSLIYNKILNLSGTSRKYLQTGQIMNYINVDVMSFYFFIMMSTFLMSAPFMITIAIVLLCLQVGWIGLVAPLIFLIGMFFQQKLMKRGFQLRKDMLFWSDKRSKCVNEYFGGIRIIKYYGWQSLVSDKIFDIRKQELAINFKGLMLRTYVQVLMNMLPIIASITIFTVFVVINGEQELTPAKVYTVLSLFNLIAIPMRLVVMSIIQFINARASLDRIQHFFGYQDKRKEGFQIDDKELTSGEVILRNCVFNWDNEKVKKHNEEGKKLSTQGPGSKPPPKPEQPNKNKNQNKEKEKKKKKEKEKKLDDGIKKKKKKSKKPKKKSLLTDSNLTQNLLVEADISDLKTALTIDQLKIQSGQFIGVIGKVGSGKSALLYSILGEIDKKSGDVRRRGKIAYIPQVSWLRSTTIKENIVFEDENFDEDRYHQVLKICQLEPDLQILGGGDMTEIGEKGVNLSGGQKQRISIARAIYADADIYLIDDCLSALDSYVGNNIFHNVIRNYLHRRGKTIIFVTNAIDYTDFCDKVLVMDNARIVDQGTPQELKAENHKYFLNLKLQAKKSKATEQQEMIKQKEDAERKKSVEEQQITLDEKQKTKPKQLMGLVKVEERLKGSVPWTVYYRFFTGPGGFTAILMIIFIFLAQMVRVASDWWLGEWSSSTTNGWNLPNNYYIWIYATLSVFVGLLLYLKGVFFAKFIINTSRIVQQTLIKSLLKTPLWWYDITPTGRILARTTKDQDDLDTSLSFNVQLTTQNLFTLISSITLISIATPLYLIIAVISGVIYFFLVRLYMNSSRQIKRLQALTRAPLISHVQQTITGISVIRAFGRTQNFIAKFFTRQKDYIVATVNQNITNRWINLVTDSFSVLTIAASGYLGVLSAVVGSHQNANLIGLALVWSLQISSIMSFTLRIFADTESNMNAVVRLYDYIDNNPSQKQFDQPKAKSDDWPQEGKYTIQKISYKYRPQLPYVLKQVSFDINSKMKIGVVGRTGSGKSTLTLGLLRILQLAENEDKTMGKIILDGQNTSELGLHQLRHKVTIIPQDPTLFTGTVRSNIDPYLVYSDSEIAESLKKVELWDQIQPTSNQIAKKLDYKVDDQGANFSLGQRQLICMARALIRKPKVLLMDEATASIDEKTDETIQHMIRKEFKDATVITIAHRLNTIIYYDKILVLDQGQVKQYDKPLELVKNPQTFLGKLIRKTGKNYAQKIIAMAEKYDHSH